MKRFGTAPASITAILALVGLLLISGCRHRSRIACVPPDPPQGAWEADWNPKTHKWKVFYELKFDSKTCSYKMYVSRELKRELKRGK